jgi:hypothetical protein
MALRVELAEALDRRDQTRQELRAMMIVLRGVAALLESELAGPAPEETPRRRVPSGRWWNRLWR